MPLPVGWLLIAVSTGLLAAAVLLCLGSDVGLPDTGSASPTPEKPATRHSPQNDYAVSSSVPLPVPGRISSWEEPAASRDG
ncbi:hypothetical protein GCM10022254_64370 [Actinomadura meridiana]|uniref:Secreted protein n=1 Tax=Actinomadura meridiana TaxID=559626 RepID=A0ABP8CK37_9ACTN